MKGTELVTQIGNKIKDMSGLTGLKIQAASPDICLGLGLALIGIGVVEACAATLKVENDLREANEDIQDVKEDFEAGVYETKAEYNRELSHVYFGTAKKLTRSYFKAFLALCLGTALIVRGQAILKKRNVVLLGLYNALEGEYERYRGIVREEYGSDVDNRIAHGLRTENIEVIETDEDGKDHKKKIKNALVSDGCNPSPYSRFFAKGYTDAWCPSNEYNLTFIRAKEKIANDILNTRGWITLAEIYDMLGFEATEASLTVGWVVGNGDNKVRFGPQEIYIAQDKTPVMDEATVRFCNGYESAILLDFNVDGVIIDKLSSIGLAKI